MVTSAAMQDDEMLHNFQTEQWWKASGQREFVEVHASAPLLRVLQEASQGVKVSRVVQPDGFASDAIAGGDRQREQRDHVVHIVLKDHLQRLVGPTAKKFEICARDHGARNIGPPQERRDFLLQSNESATAVASTPQPPCAG